MLPRIVLDTNVLVAGLRSSRGASFKLLGMVGTGRFEIVLSVPLVLEYQDALGRHAEAIGLTNENLTAVIDYLCSVGKKQSIFFLWRPRLRDPKDELVLEVAVAGECNAIVSFNKKDLEGSEEFGISVLTPKEFLQQLGELK